jgi:hypothetical protein
MRIAGSMSLTTRITSMALRSGIDRSSIRICACVERTSSIVPAALAASPTTSKLEQLFRIWRRASRISA